MIDNEDDFEPFSTIHEILEVQNFTNEPFKISKKTVIESKNIKKIVNLHQSYRYGGLCLKGISYSINIPE